MDASGADNVEATVSFRAMADGTKADYELLARHEAEHAAGSVDRLLAQLAALDGSFGGYQVSRLEHSLQSATRARRDGAGVDWVVAALLHDIGDLLAPLNHSEIAAAVLQPYVPPEVHWVVRHHGVFQLAYYGNHVGLDPNERNRYRGHPWFDRCVEFCHRWDQPSFDPDYPADGLDSFEDDLRTVFGRTPWDQAVVGDGSDPLAS
ncbi:MAG: HD domain-containing protein [Actinomycetota bacterium]